jgi:hypothetical protein
VTRRFRFRLPDEELRSFICNSDADMGEQGFFSEGWVSHGELDNCPWTDRQLGYGNHPTTGYRGRGDFERHSECLRTWIQVSREHQEILVAYYGLYDVAVTTEAYFAEHGSRLLPVGVTRKLLLQMPQTAWIAVILARRENAYQELVQPSKSQRVRNWGKLALDANLAAHAVWADIRSRVEHRSAIEWRTGVLA